MGKVPFQVDSYRGEVPKNWYPAADSDKGVVLYGTCGLTPWATISTGTAVRDMKSMGDYLYVLADTTTAARTFKINSSGTVSVIGDIGRVGLGKGWVLDNGTQVWFVDGETAAVYTPSTDDYTLIRTLDFPGASCATYQDGYGIFIKPDSGQVWITGLYDFTSYDALDFATEEGSPDNLVACLSDHRELWLFGTHSTGIWYNSGGTFPFSRLPSGFIEVGCGAVGTPVKLDNSIYWLSNDLQICSAQNYNPIVVSSRKMDREVYQYSQVSDATAFGFIENGHSFYHITFPTERVTWVYDTSTKLWHKRQSYRIDSVYQGRHRANCYCHFAGKHLVGDFENGIIYEMSPTVYTDNTYPISREFQFEANGNGSRMIFPAVQVEFDHGQGLYTGQGADPQVMMSWSNDDGYTWSPEVWATSGAIGKYRTRTIFRRLGSSFNRVFKVQVTDPIKWNVLGVNMPNNGAK